jgi:hypothetical protein
VADHLRVNHGDKDWAIHPLVGVVKHRTPAFQDRVGVLLAALRVRISEHRKVIDVPANRDFEEPAGPASDVALLPIYLPALWMVGLKISAHQARVVLEAELLDPDPRVDSECSQYGARYPKGRTPSWLLKALRPSWISFFSVSREIFVGFSW